MPDLSDYNPNDTKTNLLSPQKMLRAVVLMAVVLTAPRTWSLTHVCYVSNCADKLPLVLIRNHYNQVMLHLCGD